MTTLSFTSSEIITHQQSFKFHEVREASSLCLLCKEQCAGKGFSNRFFGLYFTSPEDKLPQPLYMCDDCGYPMVEADDATLEVDGVQWTYEFSSRIND